MTFVRNLFDSWMTKRMRANMKKLIEELILELTQSSIIADEVENGPSSAHRVLCMLELTLQNFEHTSVPELSRKLGFIECYFQMSHGITLGEFFQHTTIKLPTIKF